MGRCRKCILHPCGNPAANPRFLRQHFGLLGFIELLLPQRNYGRSPFRRSNDADVLKMRVHFLIPLDEVLRRFSPSSRIWLQVIGSNDLHALALSRADRIRRRRCDSPAEIHHIHLLTLTGECLDFGLFKKPCGPLAAEPAYPGVCSRFTRMPLTALRKNQAQVDGNARLTPYSP